MCEKRKEGGGKGWLLRCRTRGEKVAEREVSVGEERLQKGK